MEYEDIEGKGLFDILKNIKDRVVGFVTGVRDDYPPKVRDLLQRYGDNKIISITVRREPLQKAVDFAVNILSKGKFDEAKKQGGFDTFYHLFLIATLDNGVKLRIEKNEVINIEVDNKTYNTDNFQVNMSPIVLNTFLQNTLQGMGTQNYFYYNPITNNCQVYLLALMKNNNLLSNNSGLEKFILQDTTTLQNQLSSGTQKGMKYTTDLARRFNILIKGKGLEDIDNLQEL
jgi:hypothetical protein